MVHVIGQHNNINCEKHFQKLNKYDKVDVFEP